MLGHIFVLMQNSPGIRLCLQGQMGDGNFYWLQPGLSDHHGVDQVLIIQQAMANAMSQQGPTGFPNPATFSLPPPRAILHLWVGGRPGSYPTR